MKFFIDTASLEEIRKIAEIGIIDGVTTNPTLISREGAVDFHQHIKEICQLIDGPVSAEVLSLERNDMVSEARELSALAPNVVIKLPMNLEGLKAAKILNQEGIKTNVTLVFSANQALLAAKAGATYVSPFVGRLDDCAQEGMDVVREIRAIYWNYDIKTEIIAASIRSPLHVKEVALAGAHIATIPFKVIEAMSRHPLTDIGIEQFLADWDKLKG